MIDDTLLDTEEKMDKAVAVAKEEFGVIRTGRAHPAMFNKLTAEYYGTPTPLNQLAQISAPEPRLLVVQVYDKSQIGAVEKALRSGDMGLNPANDGQIIRVPIPPLTEERRKEMVKLVKSEAEDAKIAVRNIRRDANESLKKMVKDKSCSEDDERRSSEEVQKLTDKAIADIDKMVVEKEKEVLTV